MKIEIPFGVRDSELKGREYTIPEGMKAVIEGGKIIVKEKESEDERIRKEIRQFILDTIGEISVDDKENTWLVWLEKQKEQKQSEMEKKYVRTLHSLISDFLCGKQEIDTEYYQKIWDWLDNRHIPGVYIPKFRVGDKVLSTKNHHLTYNIIEVGLINELGNPEYQVEILTDGQSDTPLNIHFIECQKMDSWGELVEQKPVEWSLPKDFEEAVYKVTNFISPFDSQDELRRASHRFAEQLMSLAKEELVEKPTEWSVEDEKIMDEMRETFINLIGDKPDISPNQKWSAAVNFIDRLKSLRPQSQWKPSEEQMNALKNIAYGSYQVGDGPVLRELYDNLKKL